MRLAHYFFVIVDVLMIDGALVQGKLIAFLKINQSLFSRVGALGNIDVL
jgi:hypothetical protein